jgi:hypothetical protein
VKDISFTLSDDELRQLIAAKYQVIPSDVSVTVHRNQDDRTGMDCPYISVTIRKFDLAPRPASSPNTSQFADRPAGFGPYSS